MRFNFIKLIKILALLFALSLVLLVTTGHKTFYVWTQVTYMLGYHDQQNDPVISRSLFEQEQLMGRSGKFSKLGRIDYSLYDTESIYSPIAKQPEPISNADTGALHGFYSTLLGEFHKPRVLLVLPSTEIGRILGVSFNKVFSIYVLVIIGAVTFLLSESMKFRKLSRTSFYFAVMALVLLAITMNGRMIFALLASALLIYSFERFIQCKDSISLKIWLISPLLVLALSMVGTGVYAAHLLLLGSGAVLLLMDGKITKAVFVLYGLILLLFGGPYLFTGLIKNMDYYGNLPGLLSHGYGKILLSQPFVLAVSAIGLAILFYAVRKYIRSYMYLYLFAVLGLILTSVGDSILLVSLLPLMLIGLEISERIINSALLSNAESAADAAEEESDSKRASVMNR